MAHRKVPYFVDHNVHMHLYDSSETYFFLELIEWPVFCFFTIVARYSALDSFRRISEKGCLEE